MWLRNKAFLVLCVVLVALLMLGQKEVMAAQTEQREWEKRATGSAGVLEGRSVLISIFVDDATSRWGVKDQREVNKKLRHVTGYIRKQSRRYGKQAELVADFEKHKDLAYRYSVSMNVKDDSKSQDKIYRKCVSFIRSKVDVEKIRSRYQTDSIGFLLHFDKYGLSSTQVHYAESDSSTFYECSSLFSKYKKQAETAAMYAHEILHLFGARDLYERSILDGISGELVRHIEKRFPNDIMYSTYARDGRQFRYRITNEISRVTAYFLGWRKNVPEVKRYQLPRLEQTGCFVEATAWEG